MLAQVAELHTIMEAGDLSQVDPAWMSVYYMVSLSYPRSAELTLPQVIAWSILFIGPAHLSATYDKRECHALARKWSKLSMDCLHHIEWWSRPGIWPLQAMVRYSRRLRTCSDRQRSA